MKQLKFLRAWLVMLCLVLSTGVTWGEEYSFTIQTSDFNTTSYAANNGSHDFTATCTSDANKTMTVACTSNQIMQSSSVMQWQKSNGYIYNTTDLGTIKSVTVNSSAGTFTTNYGTSEHPTSGTTVGNGFFTVKVGSATGKTSSIVVVFEQPDSSIPTITAPIFDVAADTYTEDQLVLIDNYDKNYLYAFTTDGTDPAFDENLDVTNGTLYDENEGIEITSSCILKAIAVDEDGNASSITSAKYVINKPQVFASLEDLVAADLASGTTVTVSFEDKAIKSIYTSSQSKRQGVYFNIQKGGHDIEIYYNSTEVPAEWVAGGTLSGTMTCPWTYYERGSTWELAPEKDTWAWTNLTYSAPVVKTITALEVSGTPTKTTYNVGDEFDTAGLVVTATYSDESTAEITEGFEWEIDYGTGNEAFVAGATSVDVMTYIGEDVMSEIYTVNGITVIVPVTLTSIAVSGTPTKTEYYAGDAFETAGLVVTATYSDGTTATITEGLEWTVDPETLTEGTTSVDVIAGLGSVVSEAYTVEGLTVTKPDFETVTYDFSSFTSAQTVELTDLDGFVITLSKGEGSTNPAWSSNQARLYAKGYLSVKANNAIIKSIEYDYAVNANKNGVSPTIDGVEGKTSEGTWDVENKTWTGADEEVTFSTSGSAGNIGFTKLVIKYVEGSKTETSLAWSATEAEVTIGAEDNVFPTLTTTPGGLLGVTYESSNTAVATIAEDGTITLVTEGNTTITASYAGDAEHTAATSVSYTLKVNKAPFVPTPVSDGYETVDFTTIEPYKNLGNNGSADMTTYEGSSFSVEFAKKTGTNNAPKYYQNGNAVRVYVSNTISIKTAEPIFKIEVAYVEGYCDKNDDGTLSVSVSEGSISYDKNNVLNWWMNDDDTKEVVLTAGSTSRFTSITVYYKGVVLVAQNDEKTSYYATFSSDKDVEFVDAEVYTVTVSEGKISLHEVSDKQVPAGNGVLIKTPEARAPYKYVEAESSLEDNMLVPCTSTDCPTVEGDNVYYKLAYYNYTNKEGLGFWWGAKGGTNNFSVKIGTAILCVPKSEASSKGFGFNALDDTNTIESVESENSNDVIYNLQGIRLNSLQKGINIVNGRKVIR